MNLYESLRIVNLSNNDEIILDKPFAPFLLADNNAIDWGEVQFNIPTYTTPYMVGVQANRIGVNSQRDIAITGYVINDNYGTIKSKKQILNRFTNVAESIRIFVDDKYYIDGVFSRPVQYPIENSENNDILSSFQLSITCLNPCFRVVDSSIGTNSEVYKKLFVMPIIWEQNKKIIMGYQTDPTALIINNNGNVDVGFTIEITFLSECDGLKIKNLRNGDETRIDSSVTFENGDKIRIISETGKKSIEIKTTTDSEFKNAIRYMDLSSDFVTLKPGKNELSISDNLTNSTILNFANIDVKITVNPMLFVLEEQ